jgi:hypothetical protein
LRQQIIELIGTDIAAIAAVPMPQSVSYPDLFTDLAAAKEDYRDHS